MWITSSSLLSFSHPCHLALRYHVTDGTSEFLLTEQSALCELPKKTEQLVILFLSLRGVTHCESNLLCLWTATLCVLLSWDYFNTTFTWIGQNCSSTVFVLHTKFVKFKVKLVTLYFKNIERLYMSWSQKSLMAPSVHFKCFCCCCCCF